MSYASFELANRKSTSDPLLVAVLQAKKINRLLGTNLLPWELRDLPEEEIEAILSLEKVGEYAQGLAKVADVFAKWKEDYHAKK